ncbi:MAG: 30S ribosomal protein S18 [Patescibacteria group bacterium]|nr:30S ribosomal protein S18 [Patescibacteria group bacterium]
MPQKDFFQKFDTTPDYKDVDNLVKFLSARMKILPREKTGVNAKNQKALTKAIKYARYLALIPYTSYQKSK